MYKILQEDDALIVVHKPAGLAVQTKAVWEEDLESLLRRHRQTQGDASDYIGVVHRLDQPVEGILVFAKTPEAASALSEQVQDPDGAMQKEYRAVVFGKMPADHGTLTDYLRKDARTNTSSVTSDRRAGKRSILDYEVILSEEHTQILRIRLKTGRHHQIRVQLSHAGCPILGDTKYKSPESEAYAKARGIRQLQLFADHLVFLHPKDRRKMEFFLK